MGLTPGAPTNSTYNGLAPMLSVPTGKFPKTEAQQGL
ncbi:hypothetical protein BJY24_007144 [Nocardia transvalensis]|uniref:Uncharacterized protein n=1 Tax=Nocardia transvalensis TaxID=37333 RepID=A0A7W9PLA2_9NOCA|nr:hypothetical protein [Nocardia transvalensis]